MSESKIFEIEKELRGYDVAIVTGASSGIGEAFLLRLFQCANSRIFTLSRTPPQLSDPRITHIACDLSSDCELRSASESLVDILSQTPCAKILLINNAGFGAYGEFPAPSLERNLEMISVNVRALTLLSGALLPLIKAGRGSIINIASTAAWQPCPQLSVYAATKAYVMSFSLALSAELESVGCKCLCVCPGPTSSNFFRAAGFGTPPLPSGFGHKSAQVADSALLALSRGKKLKVVGAVNKIQTFFVKILPVIFTLKISGFILKKIRSTK